MRTVIFDLFHAQPQGGSKFHGGGEYIKSIFTEIVKNHYADVDINVFYDYDSFLDDWIKDAISANSIKSFDVKNIADIEALLHSFKGLSNCTFFTGMLYNYIDCNIPKSLLRIGTCHGLRAFEKPTDREAWRYSRNKKELYDFIYHMVPLTANRFAKAAANNSYKTFDNFDIIITDSEYSKYSILVNLPKLPKNKDIRVYYAPLKHSTAITNRDKGEDYILMVSADRWLKNSYRGLLGIDRLYSNKLIDIPTHVYGNLPDGIWKKIENKSYFQRFGYVETSKLEEAYFNCKLFFYPTLNEGFGLPPLEAMKYGKTCLISAVCSLPEVYGDSVYYCNPYDIMEMENRILQSLKNPKIENVIHSKINNISKRQEKDLHNLCDLIIGNSDKL